MIIMKPQRINVHKEEAIPINMRSHRFQTQFCRVQERSKDHNIYHEIYYVQCAAQFSANAKKKNKIIIKKQIEIISTE